VIWHKFDYEDRVRTAPPAYEPVWIVEVFYGEARIGFYDGHGFRVVPGESDDCSVSWWAPIQYPPQPKEGR
jgi:hypothetical protein